MERMLDGVSSAEVRNHLKAILESRFFAKKGNARCLLKFLVDETLSGKADTLTRRDVLQGCFSLQQDEQLVSTEKRRLRQHIAQYYMLEGASAPFQFAVSENASFRIEIKQGQALTGHSLAGRRKELSQLAEWTAEALGGAFSLVLVEGNAGFGKTALVDAHLAHCKKEFSGIRFGLATTQDLDLCIGSYQAIDDGLRSLCTSTQGASRSDLRSLLESVAPAWAIRVLDSTRNSPASKSQLSRFLEVAAQSKPVVMVLEDVHHSDSSLVSYLAHLLAAAPSHVQLILTYRPEQASGWKKQLLRLLDSSNAHRLQLGSLKRTDIADYLNKRFQPNIFPAALSAEILQMSDGCPFFIKKIADHLESIGVLLKDSGKRKDHWQLASNANQVAAVLPSDLESIIDLSFSQLDHEDQKVLLAGALQGEEFESAIVGSALGADPEEVEERLQNVARRSDLIGYSQSWMIDNKIPSVRYRFRHSLYYRGILRAFEKLPAKRARWAQLTAEGLASTIPSRPNLDGTLATLWVLAGQHEKALEHHLRAAKALLAELSYDACQRTAREGLRVASHCTETDRRDAASIELMAIFGVAAISSNGFSDPEAHAMFDSAVELAKRKQWTAVLPELLYGQWTCKSGRDGFDVALKWARELSTLASDSSPVEAAKGQFVLGVSLLHLGRLKEAADTLDSALTLSAGKTDQSNSRFSFEFDERVTHRCQLARAVCLLGDNGRSRSLLDEAVAIARGINHPSSLSYALIMDASVSAIIGDHRRCKVSAEEAASLAYEFGFFQQEKWTTVLESYAAHSLNGDSSHLMRCAQACEAYEAAGCVVASTEMLSMVAKMYLREHAVDLAQGVLDKALVLSERAGERYFLPELLRLRADCLSQSAHKEESLAVLQNAMEIARDQGACRWELAVERSFAESAEIAAN